MQHGDDLVSMEAREELVIPAGVAVELRPGSLHVMLYEIPTLLQEGDQVAVTLTFEQAGEVSFTAPVYER